MKNFPMISVLMPVFNSEFFIIDSVSSILRQTFADFEFIIVNDGSTDNSRMVLEEMADLDKRIRILNQENRGIVEALNCGLREARGKYIARMDSDDISLPNRLAKQFAFMESNCKVGACGSWIMYFGGKDGVWQTSPSTDDIKCELLFNSAIAHPSVMIRASILSVNGLVYRERFRRDGDLLNWNSINFAEDYDLWVRIGRLSELANIPEVLLMYRVHESQIVQKLKTEKIKSSNIIRQEQIFEWGLKFSKQETEIHNRIGLWDIDVSFVELSEMGLFLKKLIIYNRTFPIYESTAFINFIGKRWLSICIANSKKGLGVFYIFFKFAEGRIGKFFNKSVIKFFIKCLIR
jgi:glycosyltransferase involved in cell wall biosynthesis